MEKENRKSAGKRYGRVVILGRPNTGKSTLLNSLMNQKVSITSPLPQTTRKNIEAVYSDSRGEIVFVDTPGLMVNIQDLVGKRVNLEATKSVGKADVVVMIVDISREKNEEENKVIGLVRKSKAKKVLVYNKIDKAVGSKDHTAEYNYLEEEFDKTIGVSALQGKHVAGLVKIIFDLLPKKRKPAEAKTGAGEGKKELAIKMGSKEYIEEIIREKAYLFLREEVPYSIKVRVDKIVDKQKLLLVKGAIITTADRYKKMIIGKGGRKIKEIGYNARKELELMSGRKIFLELMVEVDKHWPEAMI